MKEQTKGIGKGVIYTLLALMIIGGAIAGVRNIFTTPEADDALSRRATKDKITTDEATRISVEERAVEWQNEQNGIWLNHMRDILRQNKHNLTTQPLITACLEPYGPPQIDEREIQS